MLEIKKSEQPKEIEAMRRMIKDRGGYLYFLLAEAKERGLDWEGLGRAALTKYGCMRFEEAFARISGLDDFVSTYLSDTTKKVFDSDLIERDSEHLVIKANYCPLMHAWVECGGSDEYVAALCDIAMDGDRAMVNSIPALRFRLRKSLAFGNPQCEFLVELDKKEETK
jgi:hypothetical protein